MTVRTRKTSTAQATASVVDAEAKFQEGGAAHAEFHEAQKNFAHAAESVWAAMGIEVPSTTKTIVVLISRIALYAVGFVGALYVTAALSAVLQAWGWPVFIIAVIEFMAIVLGVIATWIASDRIVDYVAAGNVTRDIKRSVNWVRSKFTGAAAYVRSATVH